jgi:hypothetical protein
MPGRVPLFLRVKVKMETTGTFKYQKTRLKDEASTRPGPAMTRSMPGCRAPKRTCR